MLPDKTSTLPAKDITPSLKLTARDEAKVSVPITPIEAPKREGEKVPVTGFMTDPEADCVAAASDGVSVPEIDSFAEALIVAELRDEVCVPEIVSAALTVRIAEPRVVASDPD